jgi:hypothetical protein
MVQWWVLRVSQMRGTLRPLAMAKNKNDEAK